MMSSKFMLDTNTISFFLKKHSAVVDNVTRHPIGKLCISAISGGELEYGLAKNPQAIKLQKVVAEFLVRVEILPWDSTIMAQYGRLRAELQKTGKPLGALDLLIAAHALKTKMILVTNDAAFSQVTGLKLTDWTKV